MKKFLFDKDGEIQKGMIAPVKDSVYELSFQRLMGEIRRKTEAVGYTAVGEGDIKELVNVPLPIIGMAINFDNEKQRQETYLILEYTAEVNDIGRLIFVVPIEAVVYTFVRRH